MRWYRAVITTRGGRPASDEERSEAALGLRRLLMLRDNGRKEGRDVLGVRGVLLRHPRRGCGEVARKRRDAHSGGEVAVVSIDLDAGFGELLNIGDEGGRGESGGD
jgi:hypothetical protein